MEVKFLAVHDFTKILLSFADHIDHRLSAIEKKQNEHGGVLNYNFTKLIAILVSELKYQDFNIFKDISGVDEHKSQEIVDSLRITLSQTLIPSITPYDQHFNIQSNNSLREQLSERGSPTTFRKDPKSSTSYEMNKEDVILFNQKEASSPIKNGIPRLNFREDESSSLIQRRSERKEPSPTAERTSAKKQTPAKL